MMHYSNLIFLDVLRMLKSFLNYEIYMINLENGVILLIVHYVAVSPHHMWRKTPVYINLSGCLLNIHFILLVMSYTVQQVLCSSSSFYRSHLHPDLFRYFNSSRQILPSVPLKTLLLFILLSISLLYMSHSFSYTFPCTIYILAMNNPLKTSTEGYL